MRSGYTHVRRAKNRAVPVGHEQVIALVQAVGTCLYRIVSEVFRKAGGISVCLPAPRPFSPFSSSSSRRKLRGTFALIVVAGWCGCGMCMRQTAIDWETLQ